MFGRPLVAVSGTGRGMREMMAVSRCLGPGQRRQSGRRWGLVQGGEKLLDPGHVHRQS